MNDLLKTTTDHEEIKKWVEDKGGRPQKLDNEEAGSDSVGLRIDFKGIDDDIFLSGANKPKNISWEEFFEIFDSLNYAFSYKEKVKKDDAIVLSESYKFIRR